MAVGERLRLLFCDHLSLARGKYLPASKIGNGSSRFCQGTYAVTYDKELVPAPGGTMLEGLPDMDAVYVEEDVRAVPECAVQAKIGIAVAVVVDSVDLPLVTEGVVVGVG